MKQLFLFLICSISFCKINSQQGSWVVRVNNKTIVAASAEDEKANCKKVKKSVWKKDGYLTIDFKEDEPGVWIRSFLFNDEDDYELIRKEGSSKLSIPIKDVKKIFNGKKEICIYTSVSPVDTTLAVRMRRVHIATLCLPN